MSTPPTWPPPPPPPAAADAAGRPRRPDVPRAGAAAEEVVGRRDCRDSDRRGLRRHLRDRHHRGDRHPGALAGARERQRSRGLGTMRTMVSAQTAWSTTHDGRYVKASCLGAPATCGDAQASSFLTPEIASPAAAQRLRLRPRPATGSRRGSGATARMASAGHRRRARRQPARGTHRCRSAGAARAVLDARHGADRAGREPRASRPRRPHRPIAAASPTGRRRPIRASPATGASAATRRASSRVPPGPDWTPPSDDQPRCPDTGRPLQ